MCKNIVDEYKNKRITESNDKEISLGRAIVEAYVCYREMIEYITHTNNNGNDKYNDYLKNIFKDCKKSFKDITFRSRLFYPLEEPHKVKELIEHPKNKDFQGYSKEDSFVYPGDWPSSGRMNKYGIKCLYTASDIDTSILEIDPSIDSYVSVATIECKEELSIVDLSKSESSNNDDFLRYLSLLIQERLKLGNSENDYIFPQYIASVCQSLGYDGIGYRSRFSNNRLSTRYKAGINYAIFNFDKCEATSSRVFTVNKLSITSSIQQEENLKFNKIAAKNKSSFLIIILF